MKKLASLIALLGLAVAFTVAQESTTDGIKDSALSPVDQSKIDNSVQTGNIYTDRGDAGAWDFQLGDLTTDGTYRDLDLSSIVGANSALVLIRVQIRDNVANSALTLRENGNSGNFNSNQAATQVGSISVLYTAFVRCDENGVIEYRASNLVWQEINLVVVGWFK